MTLTAGLSAGIFAKTIEAALILRVPFKCEYFLFRFICLSNASGSFVRVWSERDDQHVVKVVAHTSFLSTLTHILPFPAFVSKGYPPSPALTLSSRIFFSGSYFLPTFHSCPFPPSSLARLSCKSSSLFMINHKFLKYVKN